MTRSLSMQAGMVQAWITSTTTQLLNPILTSSIPTNLWGTPAHLCKNLLKHKTTSSSTLTGETIAQYAPQELSNEVGKDAARATVPATATTATTAATAISLAAPNISPASLISTFQPRLVGLSDTIDVVGTAESETSADESSRATTHTDASSCGEINGSAGSDQTKRFKALRLGVVVVDWDIVGGGSSTLLAKGDAWRSFFRSVSKDVVVGGSGKYGLKEMMA
jgi:hypothetical protein